MASIARFAGPEGWLLTPEGAVVQEDERTAVIADVHLGYEWCAVQGATVSPRTRSRKRWPSWRGCWRVSKLDRLVVAGDLVESPKPCRRTEQDVAILEGWLAARGVSLVVLAGNHDPARSRAGSATLEVAGWTIAHGHRPVPGPKTITGHLHPVLRAGAGNAPCFLVSRARLVLPAFSENAAGVGVLSERFSGADGGRPYQCVAMADGCLFDFGSLDALRVSLGERRRSVPASAARDSHRG